MTGQPVRLAETTKDGRSAGGPAAVQEREVVVVGAGPAGAAVACFLAQGGRDVLVLEAARFPRDKVCGESVSPEAWRLLDRMGASAPLAALSPQPVHGMRLVAPDGTSFRGVYRGRDRVGFALRRLVLDPVLVDRARAAGAEVREGVRVARLVRPAGAVTGVELEDGALIRARLVIGADGRGSVVARQLGLLREHPRLRRFAVRGHWSGVGGLEALGEMHVAPRGYCGIAPLSGSDANVAFVLEATDMPDAAGDLEGFYLRQLAARWPGVWRRLADARLCAAPRAVGPLALECRSVTAPGALLVGDAAGFYDPFTGEGITLALRGAELASKAADAALAESAGSRAPLPRLLRYERARRLATRDKFRFNRLLQQAVGRPWLANAIARRLARRPALADRLVGIAGDFVPARAAFGARFLLDLLC